MLEVNFYENMDDNLLKFAVIISKQTVNGYFASIKSVILMKYPEDIEKKMKPLWKLPNGN